MNQSVKYISGMAALLVCTVVMNIVGYRFAMDELQEMQVDYENRVSEQVEIKVTKQLEEEAGEYVKMATDASESIATNTTEQNLTVDTIYEIQHYDVTNDTMATDYETLPEELVGFSREDVEEYCKEYMDAVPVEEYLDGLQSMGVVSFSKERLIVKKIYDSKKVLYRYYIIAVDGEVVVYYGDKKNVYEYTGISTKKLSQEEKSALKNGIEVKNEDELYSILENYSS